MDNVSWGALALALSLLAAIWTWYAFQRRGPASGVRGVALVLLPIAAYLTRTLRLLGRIGHAIGDWAAGFVFSPTVWVGLVIAAVAFVLLYVATRLPGGERDERTGSQAQGAARSRRTRHRAKGTAPVTSQQRTPGAPAIGGDEDFADIQAILRKHGIS